MSPTLTRLVVASCWLLAVAGGLILRLSLGWPVSPSVAIAFVLLGMVPVFMLMVLSRAPALSASQIIYDVRHETDPGRVALPRLERQDRS